VPLSGGVVLVRAAQRRAQNRARLTRLRCPRLQTSLFVDGGGGGQPEGLVPRDARGNAALLLPPELLKGQLAINGDLHVTDRVLVPGGSGADGVPACRLADFEFFGGRAFASSWPAGAPTTAPPTPRAVALQPCAALPCNYRIPDLYGRGTRLSLEVTVKYHHFAALCDPWCAPGAAWWCVPCSGAYGQTIAILGGCAPFQPLCGGALALWVTDAGELRWGALTYATAFGLAAVELGGGLRVVDVSVPGRGFIAKHGATFKVLVTFDNVCQCVKLYVNDKLRGVGDPAAFARFGWPRFANVTGNLHEEITLGAYPLHAAGVRLRRSSWDARFDVATCICRPGAAWHAPTATPSAAGASPKGAALLNALRPFGAGAVTQAASKWQDISLPTFGGYAVWPSDPLLSPTGGGTPTQLYLPWAGDILSALLWLDNYGQRGGTVYPSACAYPAPPDSPAVWAPPGPPGARAAAMPAEGPPPSPPPPPPPGPAPVPGAGLAPSPPPPRPPPSARTGVPSGSCEGICGLCTGCLDAACSCCCDLACVEMGDCCADREAHCAARNVTAVGGVLGVDAATQASIAQFAARAGALPRPALVRGRPPPP
jgi:hypothetical protein